MMLMAERMVKKVLKLKLAISKGNKKLIPITEAILKLKEKVVVAQTRMGKAKGPVKKYIALVVRHSVNQIKKQKLADKITKLNLKDKAKLIPLEKKLAKYGIVIPDMDK